MSRLAVESRTAVATIAAVGSRAAVENIAALESRVAVATIATVWSRVAVVSRAARLDLCVVGFICISSCIQPGSFCF